MIGVSLRRIPPDRPGAGIPVVRLHYTADPSFTPEQIAKLKSTYTSEARWNRELEIDYEALEGELLYPNFKPDVNLCDSFDVSDTSRWTIYMGADPHPRTPHAFVWEAVSVRGDRIICGELWPMTRYPVSEYADAIKMLEGDSMFKPEPFEWARGKKLRVHERFMDTFGRAANSDEGEDYFETYAKYKLMFMPALKGEKNLAKAQDEINRMLKARVDEHGRPALSIMHVFRGCKEIIGEFQNVRYPEGDPMKPGDERPVTYRKHCLDCAHYIETQQPRFVMLRYGRQGEVEPLNKATGW